MTQWYVGKDLQVRNWASTDLACDKKPAVRLILRDYGKPPVSYPRPLGQSDFFWMWWIDGNRHDSPGRLGCLSSAKTNTCRNLLHVSRTTGSVSRFTMYRLNRWCPLGGNPFFDHVINGLIISLVRTLIESLQEETDFDYYRTLYNSNYSNKVRNRNYVCHKE